MLYEGVLLFGVLMLAGLLYGALTQQRHALQGQTGLQVFLFLVLGGYFVGFWCLGGQTLAMKTWRIRLVGPDGRHPSVPRAIARYLLGWLWFAPALLALHLSDVQGGLPLSVALAAGVAAYAALARLRPDRQFWHDAVCATQLLDERTKGSEGPRTRQVAVETRATPAQHKPSR
jgi:uncharacterized RDD family membrane protein YckC